MTADLRGLSELWRDIGAKGDFDCRAKWDRLGSGRNRVWELIVSDPVKAVVVGAFAEISGGVS